MQVCLYIIRLLEDGNISLEQKKPFTFLLTEAYLISDQESMKTVSVLARSRSVIFA